MDYQLPTVNQGLDNQVRNLLFPTRWALVTSYKWSDMGPSRNGRMVGKSVISLISGPIFRCHVSFGKQKSPKNLFQPTIATTFKGTVEASNSGTTHWIWRCKGPLCAHFSISCKVGPLVGSRLGYNNSRGLLS